jgi:hypothetical protein
MSITISILDYYFKPRPARRTLVTALALVARSRTVDAFLPYFRPSLSFCTVYTVFPIVTNLITHVNTLTRGIVA